jgi:hypothetical protein
VKMLDVNAGIGDHYYFPDEGKDMVDVTVTVQWGPHQDGLLKFVIKPFAPVDPFGVSIRPVVYPGRTHAKNAKEAKRIARELFSHSLYCLRLNHGECVSAYGGHLASVTDWPDAPKCECECHGKGN